MAREAPTPPGTVFAITAAMCGGLISFYFIPVFVGMLQSVRGISSESATLVASIELGSAAVAAIGFGRGAMAGGVRKIIATGGVLGFAGNGTFFFAHALWSLTGAAIVAGVGQGLFFAGATIAGARQTNPSRVYGRVYALSSLLFTLALLMLPSLVQRWGTTSYFGLNLVVVAIVVLSLPSFANIPAAVPQETTDSRGGKSRTAALLHLTLAALFIPIGGLWGLADQLASQHGISARAIGIAFAASNAAGIAGGALAARIRSGAGTLPLIAASTVAMVLVGAAESVVRGPFEFVVTMAVLGLVYIFLISYLVSVGALIDGSGALSSSLNGASLILLSVGPALYGLVLSHLGMYALIFGNLVVCAVAIPAAWTLHLALAARTHRRSPAY